LKKYAFLFGHVKNLYYLCTKFETIRKIEIMEVNYDFLKRFSEKAEQALADTGNMPKCSILVFSPVKVKKGTKNNPSPFYDREMITENDNERYTLFQLKRYSFLFGDKYEPEQKPEEVTETEEPKEKVITRIHPDEACRMLYQSLKTSAYTIDVVNPEKVGNTIYYTRSIDPISGTAYTPVKNDSPLMESVKEWKPTHNGEYKPIVYQQFTLGTVVSLTLQGDENNENEEFVNQAFVENNLRNDLIDSI